jgi:hypothetical protein
MDGLGSATVALVVHQISGGEKGTIGCLLACRRLRKLFLIMKKIFIGYIIRSGRRRSLE